MTKPIVAISSSRLVGPPKTTTVTLSIDQLAEFGVTCELCVQCAERPSTKQYEFVFRLGGGLGIWRSNDIRLPIDIAMCTRCAAAEKARRLSISVFGIVSVFLIVGGFLGGMLLASQGFSTPSTIIAAVATLVIGIALQTGLMPFIRKQTLEALHITPQTVTLRVRDTWHIAIERDLTNAPQTVDVA